MIEPAEHDVLPLSLARAPIANSDALEHDPEKCEAIFRKDHAQTMN